MLLEFNQREVYRYLGYNRNIPDDNTKKLILECENELLQVMTPRHIYRCFDLEVDGQGTIHVAGMELVSRNLSVNLKGCNKAIIMAATLGIGADKLLHKYNMINMAKAVIVQAAAAAYMESYCDHVNELIAGEYRSKELYLRPRYSPGYGDLGLDCQEQVLACLNAGKQIGITLTDGGIMLPEKSVTAIIGVSTTNLKCSTGGCEICDNANCQFRRNQ